MQSATRKLQPLWCGPVVWAVPSAQPSKHPGATILSTAAAAALLDGGNAHLSSEWVVHLVLAAEALTCPLHACVQDLALAAEALSSMEASVSAAEARQLELQGSCDGLAGRRDELSEARTAAEADLVAVQQQLSDAEQRLQACVAEERDARGVLQELKAKAAAAEHRLAEQLPGPQVSSSMQGPGCGSRAACRGLTVVGSGTRGGGAWLRVAQILCSPPLFYPFLHHHYPVASPHPVTSPPSCFITTALLHHPFQLHHPFLLHHRLPVVPTLPVASLLPGTSPPTCCITPSCYISAILLHLRLPVAPTPSCCNDAHHARALLPFLLLYFPNPSCCTYPR